MSKVNGKATVIATTNAASAATSAALTGTFLVVADADVYIEQNASSPTATAPSGSSGSFMLPAKTIIGLTLAGEFVAARNVTAATGNVWIQPTSDF